MSSNKWLKKIVILGGGVILTTRMYHYLSKHRPFKQLIVRRIAKDVRPTLLVHGTNGTRRSLGGMVERWAKQGIAYKALDVEVAKDGTITLSGEWQERVPHQHPLIQVIFKEGDPPEWQQSEWVKKVLELLKDQLQITEVNCLGHSMGGVAIFRYLADYGRDLHLPKVKKIVTIGAPFNGEVVDPTGITAYDLGNNGPLNYDETYRYLSSYQANIPADLEVLNIYGDLQTGSRSDGFVSVDSARALGYLIKNKVAYYREKEITGVKAQHSLLHENKQVDRLAAHFLW